MFDDMSINDVFKMVDEDTSDPFEWWLLDIIQGAPIHTSVPSLALSDGCVPGILQILPEIWISRDIQGFHDGIQFVFGNESKILCQLRKMISAMVQQDQELIWRVLDSPTHGTLLILIGESVGQ